MLRIFVISLVVANLLLFGFQSSKPAAPKKPRASKAVVADESIPTIHLFSEILDDRELIEGSRRCFSLGPFHSVDDRDEMFNRLLQVAENVNERQTQALVEKGYWVFMPPYASLLEANEALLSLQALGLKDIGVIYNGEWENAISLGYFLRQENAVRRKQELEKRGYAPMMRVQRQSEPRYWLDYEQSPGSGLIALDMRDRPNDFSSRATPCPEQLASTRPTEISQADVEQVTVPDQEEASLTGQEVSAETASQSEGLATQSAGFETDNGNGLEEIPEAEIENPLNQDIVLKEETGDEDDAGGG